jgi:hypothetical protein
MAGWRPSADRTRLRAISLLSGNLTGNFAFSRCLETVFEQETAVPQALIKQIPYSSKQGNYFSEQGFLVQ